MVTSSLFVETERPERYVKQLLSHLTRVKPDPEGGPDRARFVSSDVEAGTQLAFTDDGTTPDESNYTLLVCEPERGVAVTHNASSEEKLERLEKVVTGHLWRFIHGREAQYLDHERNAG